ncbi:hypothetical protein WMF20_12490 [Sorangium sp. So ce834]|uniref:hypothetical protein n=1 Tax=Sorangium sp. So ce834 TaxID=3133321 RepID=UPI003F607CE7
MSSVDILTDVPFPGWPSWEAALDTLQVPQAPVIVSQVIANAIRNDGVFTNAGPLSALSVPPLMLRFLSRWRDAGFCLDCATPKMTDAAKTALLRCARQLHSRRRQHVALSGIVKLPSPLQLGRKIWFTTLEQQWFSRSARLEIARAQLLYGSLWTEETESTLFSSAYENLASALAVASALQSGPTLLKDIRSRFSETAVPVETALHLIDLASWTPDDLLGSYAHVGYPEAWFTSPFALRPIVKLSDNALFIPEPQYLLGTFEAQQHQAAIRKFVHDDPDGGFKHFSSAFGHVLERYAVLLLQAILKNDSVTKEFKYTNRDGNPVDSPDIFAREDASIFVVECKTVRLPDDGNATSLEALDDWIWHLGGGNDRRSPLKQGSGFIADWKAGHVPTDKLPAYTESFQYLVVCYGSPPPTANWPAFRQRFLVPHLAAPERDIEARTLFVSIRDLEKIAAVATAMAEAGEHLSLSSLVARYHEALRSSVKTVKAAPDEPPLITAGLGDFCIEQYADFTPKDPHFIEEARSALFDAANAWLFA